GWRLGNRFRPRNADESRPLAALRGSGENSPSRLYRFPGPLSMQIETRVAGEIHESRKRWCNSVSQRPAYRAAGGEEHPYMKSIRWQIVVAALLAIGAAAPA